MYRVSDRVTLTAEQAVAALLPSSRITYLELADAIGATYSGRAVSDRRRELSVRIDLLKRLGFPQCVLLAAARAMAARDGWPEATPERLARPGVAPWIYEEYVIPEMERNASRPCLCPSCAA